MSKARFLNQSQALPQLELAKKTSRLSRPPNIVEPSAAYWIVDHEIKCVGIDTLSVGKIWIQRRKKHKKLSSRNWMS